MSQSAEPAGPVTLTRDELYRLVWETPMSRLAERFGLSGNGLAKICRRLDVPYPPRGYWARLAAKKEVRATALPRAKPGTPLSTAIYRKVPKPAEELAPGLQSALSEVMAKVGVLRVPERLHKPHAIIAGWLAEHERQLELARRDRDRWSVHYRPRDFTSMDRRRHRLLDVLFKELEKRGARIGENDRHDLHAVVSGEKLEFELREKYRQVRRPLTAEELRWGSNRTGTRQELKPTGFFLFAIRSHLPRTLRREWLERDDAPIDDRLGEIAATFMVAGPIMADERRQREEEARRAEEARQRQRQDRNWWRRFTEIAAAWDEAGTARRFLLALRELDPPEGTLIDGRPLAEWLEWAEQKLKAADPIERGIAAIFGDIANVSPWTYHD